MKMIDEQVRVYIALMAVLLLAIVGQAAALFMLLMMR